MKKYRIDIDGLRAYAVIVVIIFHLGFLPNGYLGVDVFFVISGYLITSIIYKQLYEDKFSIINFYKRRIRRIIPLLLFITTLALILGLLFMLPDDLENLAQSVVASNFSLNNILMLVTSSDYWATKNEYKPLMHTWSLGIEEQFYLIYPFLLVLIAKININLIKYLLLITSFVSITLFIFAGNEATRFYLLHFRFFELSVGGLLAIFTYNVIKINNIYKNLFFVSFIALLALFFLPIGSNQIKVILTTICTVIVLALGKYYSEDNNFSNFFLKNRVVVYLGKISFSLYLWHQLLFAFSRYVFYEEIGLKESLFLIAITLVLSIITYHFIENPFRDNKKISDKKVYITLALFFSLTTFTATYLYLIGGLYKDYPSLGLKKSLAGGNFNFFSSTNNIHIRYNEDVRSLDVNFADIKNKTNILVIGNSFGRDVVNILLESQIKDVINISYFDIGRIKNDKDIYDRWNKADFVIVAAKKFIAKEWLVNATKTHSLLIDFSKVYCFGTKDFGYSNGIHYNNYNSIQDFTQYYTNIRKGIYDIENNLINEWSSSYISLLSPIKNSKNQVRVFTDSGVFLSQDTLHLTKDGAIFYAILLNDTLRKIFYI